jgi:hypothetical protein
MSDMLVVIETHEANIEDHELDVMSDQVILDSQEVKTTNQEPYVVGVFGMSKFVYTTLIVDSQKN